jgi:hypothetical protein
MVSHSLSEESSSGKQLKGTVTTDLFESRVEVGSISKSEGVIVRAGVKVFNGFVATPSGKDVVIGVWVGVACTQPVKSCMTKRVIPNNR